MNTGNVMVFEGPGKAITAQNKAIPELKDHEVLVKNLYTTLCGSDLHTYTGLRKEKTPAVLGHEIVGRIVKIHPKHSGVDHSGKKLRAGDLVTWSVFCSDPDSEWAQKGMPQKAPGLFKYGHAQLTDTEVFHGGLADYCVLKEHTTVLKLPGTLPLPVAATINCAVATVSGAIRLAGALQGKNVLITGMGLLGMVCAAMCREMGATRIYAADIRKTRLEQARRFGADEVFLLPSKVRSQDVPAVLREKNIAVSFDMSGAPSAMEVGLNVLETGGLCVWVGAVFNQRKLVVDAEQIVRRLITIKGLHNYNSNDLRTAVDFMVTHYKKYPFEEVVSEEFSLPETEQAFAYALKNKPLRVGIKIEP